MKANLFLWIAALCLMGVSVVVLAVTLARVVIGLIDSYGVWVVGGAAVAGIFIAGLSATVAWALQEDSSGGGGPSNAMGSSDSSVGAASDTGAAPGTPT